MIWNILFLMQFVFCFGQDADNELFENGKYLINTEKCQIPDIPAFSSDTDIPIRSYVPIPCSYFKPLTYTKVMDNVATLHVRRPACLGRIFVQNDLSCCYSYIHRTLSDQRPDSSFRASRCIKFNRKESIELRHHTVWVKCNWTLFNYTHKYENIHQIVKLSNDVKEKTENLKKYSKNRPLSVLMVVIDSVSRLNFIRTMPKTRNFVLENNFYEFKGYNKIDDNTFPNAMALLSGLNLNDSLTTCKPRQRDGLTNCPLIWYKYRDLGYATAYAEDWAPFATFNYLKKGFKDSPTDYYFKPYMDAISSLLEITYQDTLPFCAGPESQAERTLNLAKDFANTLKGSPSFGVFWMNTFSHNYINTPRTMDKILKEFFQDVKSSGIFDESMVVLLSDHGIRFGDIIDTPRGFYELRLPMNYISLPKWFKLSHPQETKYFIENAGKLTSTYDFYMTLQHILILSGLNYTMEPSRACEDCKSFFEELPENRACGDAGIPEIWCTCHGLPKKNSVQNNTFR